MNIMQLYCWHCVVRPNVLLPEVHYESTLLIHNVLSCVIEEAKTAIYVVIILLTFCWPGVVVLFYSFSYHSINRLAR